MAGGYNIQSEVNRSQAIINKVYKDKRYPPDGSKFPNTKDGRLALQLARKEYARVKAERAKQGETRANPEFQGTVPDQTYFQGEWHDTKKLNEQLKKQLAIGPTADTTSGSIESQGKAQDKVIADFQKQQRAAENLRISNEYRARQNTGDPFLNAALANQPIAEGHYDPSDNSFTSTKPSTITTKEKSADLNNAVKEELKIADKQSAFKSDVFTIDPATGKAVGVLTRNQRKKFEARADVQAALKATPQNELRIYKNRIGAG
tara:strand:- start:154 stop:939 length:786 start_codon:yes stop_codon:yes gene_type:complete